jgi:hypothetical protein
MGVMDVTIPRLRPRDMDPLEWIMDYRRNATDSGCWEWIGYRTKAGYSQLSIRGQMVLTHRYVWSRMVGPIPDGMFLDHQCRNRACFNPDHLRVVTPRVNSIENVVGSFWQIEAAKTHCPQGHPYDEANTYRRPATGARHCRACDKARGSGGRRQAARRRRTGVYGGV